MCGIVGFTGHKQAAEVLLNGLGRLEYRGYDSAGIAVLDGDDKIKMVKATGKLKNLIEKTEQGGRALIEEKGVKVYSLARIKELRAGDIKFE